MNTSYLGVCDRTEREREQVGRAYKTLQTLKQFSKQEIWKPITDNWNYIHCLNIFHYVSREKKNNNIGQQFTRRNNNCPGCTTQSVNWKTPPKSTDCWTHCKWLLWFYFWIFNPQQFFPSNWCQNNYIINLEYQHIWCCHGKLDICCIKNRYWMQQNIHPDPGRSRSKSMSATRCCRHLKPAAHMKLRTIKHSHVLQLWSETTTSTQCDPSMIKINP